MPLRAPRRLPKQFRRPVSRFTRLIAERHSLGKERRARRRREKATRLMRRFSQFSTLVASEFRIWFIVGLGVAAVLSATILLFAPFFDVRQIHVRRQDPRVDPETVQEVLSPLFNQRLVLVSKNQVQSLLRPHFPDLMTVDIEKDYPSTLKVLIVLEPVIVDVTIASFGPEPETQMGAALSGSGAPARTIQSSGSGGYTYLTRSGYFVSSPISLAKTPLERITITDVGQSPEHGTRLLSSEFLETMFRARDTLIRDFNQAPSSILVFIRAREFHIKTAATTFWFDLSSPLQEQFQRLREFLGALQFGEAKEYIDLRIKDKIVYR